MWHRIVTVSANVLAEGPNPLPDLWRTFTLAFLSRLGALDEQLHEHLDGRLVFDAGG
jgi:hypothetical protein